MRKAAVLAVIFPWVLMACATPSMIALVHPVTNDVKVCSWDTVGNLNWIDDCAKMWEGLGYRRAESLTPEERETLMPGVPTKQAPSVRF